MAYDRSRVDIGDRVRDNQSLQEGKVTDLRPLGDWLLVITVFFPLTGLVKDYQVPRGSPSPILSKVFDTPRSQQAAAREAKQLPTASENIVTGETHAKAKTLSVDYKTQKPGFSKLRAYIEQRYSQSKINLFDKNQVLLAISKLEKNDPIRLYNKTVPLRDLLYKELRGVVKQDQLEGIIDFLTDIVIDKSNLLVPGDYPNLFDAELDLTRRVKDIRNTALKTTDLESRKQLLRDAAVLEDTKLIKTGTRKKLKPTIKYNPETLYNDYVDITDYISVLKRHQQPLRDAIQWTRQSAATLRNLNDLSFEQIRTIAKQSLNYTDPLFDEVRSISGRILATKNTTTTRNLARQLKDALVGKTGAGFKAQFGLQANASHLLPEMGVLGQLSNLMGTHYQRTKRYEETRSILYNELSLTGGIIDANSGGGEVDEVFPIDYKFTKRTKAENARLAKASNFNKGVWEDYDWNEQKLIRQQQQDLLDKGAEEAWLETMSRTEQRVLNPMGSKVNKIQEALARKEADIKAAIASKKPYIVDVGQVKYAITGITKENDNYKLFGEPVENLFGKKTLALKLRKGVTTQDFLRYLYSEDLTSPITKSLRILLLGLPEELPKTLPNVTHVTLNQELLTKENALAFVANLVGYNTTSNLNKPSELSKLGEAVHKYLRDLGQNSEDIIQNQAIALTVPDYLWGFISKVSKGKPISPENLFTGILKEASNPEWLFGSSMDIYKHEAIGELETVSLKRVGQLDVIEEPRTLDLPAFRQNLLMDSPLIEGNIYLPLNEGIGLKASSIEEALNEIANSNIDKRLAKLIETTTYQGKVGLRIASLVDDEVEGTFAFIGNSRVLDLKTNKLIALSNKEIELNPNVINKFMSQAFGPKNPNGVVNLYKLPNGGYTASPLGQEDFLNSLVNIEAALKGDRPILSLDVENTAEGIIENAGIVGKHGTLLDIGTGTVPEYARRVAGETPRPPVGPSIVDKILGYSPKKQVASESTIISNVAKTLEPYISFGEASALVVGHNISYDLDLLAERALALSETSKGRTRQAMLRAVEVFQQASLRSVDTLLLTKMIKGKMAGGYSLQAIAKELEIRGASWVEEHIGLFDAQTTFDLLQKLKDIVTKERIAYSDITSVSQVDSPLQKLMWGIEEAGISHGFVRGRVLRPIDIASNESSVKVTFEELVARGGKLIGGRDLEWTGSFDQYANLIQGALQEVSEEQAIDYSSRYTADLARRQVRRMMGSTEAYDRYLQLSLGLNEFPKASDLNRAIENLPQDENWQTNFDNLLRDFNERRLKLEGIYETANLSDPRFREQMSLISDIASTEFNEIHAPLYAALKEHNMVSSEKEIILNKYFEAIEELVPFEKLNESQYTPTNYRIAFMHPGLGANPVSIAIQNESAINQSVMNIASKLTGRKVESNEVDDFLEELLPIIQQGKTNRGGQLDPADYSQMTPTEFKEHVIALAQDPGNQLLFDQSEFMNYNASRADKLRTQIDTIQEIQNKLINSRYSILADATIPDLPSNRFPEYSMRHIPSYMQGRTLEEVRQGGIEHFMNFGLTEEVAKQRAGMSLRKNITEMLTKGTSVPLDLHDEMLAEMGWQPGADPMEAYVPYDTRKVKDLRIEELQNMGGVGGLPEEFQRIIEPISSRATFRWDNLVQGGTQTKFSGTMGSVLEKLGTANLTEGIVGAARKHKVAVAAIGLASTLFMIRRPNLDTTSEDDIPLSTKHRQAIKQENPLFHNIKVSIQGDFENSVDEADIIQSVHEALAPHTKSQFSSDPNTQRNDQRTKFDGAYIDKLITSKLK